MQMQQLVKFLKCMADETRFKLLKLLLEDCLCVCELTEILEKSQPCISQHLRRFKELGLVIEERVEQWSYYEINYSLFQHYMNQLNTLKELDFASLGIEGLEKRRNEVKLVDLCNISKERCNL